MTDERRRAERIQLQQPISGHADKQAVRIIEVGLLGALIEHDAPFEPDSEARLLFSVGPKTIAIDCNVARSEIDAVRSESTGNPVYRSGLEFMHAVGDSTVLLRGLIAAHVTRMMDAHKANARGELPSLLKAPGSGSPLPTSGNQYLACRLEKGGWRTMQIMKPSQPPDGFTVAASTTPEDLEMLCKVYEGANGETRKVIRACAELSLTRDEPVPPANLRRPAPNLGAKKSR